MMIVVEAIADRRRQRQSLWSVVGFFFSWRTVHLQAEYLKNGPGLKEEEEEGNIIITKSTSSAVSFLPYCGKLAAHEIAITSVDSSRDSSLFEEESNQKAWPVRLCCVIYTNRRRELLSYFFLFFFFTYWDDMFSLFDREETLQGSLILFYLVPATSYYYYYY